jgi:prefoldin subunit 5
MNQLIAKMDSFDKKMDSLDKKMDSLLKDQIDIKKRLKNIELLSEINNDPNFSKVSFFN